MKKIGVISDTHGLLRPEVKESLKDCDAILHAGDINKPELLDELREIAPVRAVCGNADETWAEVEGLAMTTELTLFGLKIAMAHTKKAARDVAADSDIIITGHTHKYEEKTEGAQLWLNPGTCGPVRRSSPITLAIIETEGDGTFRVERIDIPHPEETKKSSGDKEPDGKSEGKSSGRKEKAEKKKSTRSSRGKGEETASKNLVQSVIRDVNAGTPIPKIAQKRGISEDLAEEICRLYVTHQGIDAEGVIQKMKQRA